MSFWDDVSNEFNNIIQGAESIPAKLEALAGLQTRAQVITSLTAQVSAIIDDGSKTTADKTTQILTLCGKL
jgi:hypothetical protein